MRGRGPTTRARVSLVCHPEFRTAVGGKGGKKRRAAAGRVYQLGRQSAQRPRPHWSIDSPSLSLVAAWSEESTGGIVTSLWEFSPASGH